MTERKRILVLTLSFGSGHVRAAEALTRELTAQDRGANVRVTDALRESRLLFRLAYVTPYWTMLRYAPALWRWYFARRLRRRSDATAPEWMFRRGCPQVFDEIGRWHPAVIVACEVAACEIAAAARRRGLTGARIIAVITDHEAEPSWVKSEVDVYAVASEEVRERLVGWGAQPERISVCGIPVGREFDEPRAESEIGATRARFGLRDGTPLALLMGGGMGPTHMDEVAAELCRAGTPLDIVAVAGHDRRALQKLELVRDEHLNARRASLVNLQAHGWLDEIAALMRAASVLVTKPGGLSTTEASACALPCVLFDAIPGPEQLNARRLVAAGAGVETGGARETAAAVLSLVGDETRRSRMAGCAARLAQPRAASSIARLALSDKWTTESGEEAVLVGALRDGSTTQVGVRPLATGVAADVDANKLRRQAI